MRHKGGETLEHIVKNYKLLEESIASQLRMGAKHSVTSGTFREKIWMSLFRQIIPQKFSIEQSVFIIDSEGNVSNEVDLAIFDEQYTPYIFQYGHLKYIPIEAVAVLVECKSQQLKRGGLEKWCASINQLTTSVNSITRIDSRINHYDPDQNRPTTQTGTRPIKILCSLASTNQDQYLNDDLFDIMLREKDKSIQLQLKEYPYLDDWYQTLNHNMSKEMRTKESEIKKIEFSPAKKYKLNDYQIMNQNGEENTILSLVFILNQLLMLINNPMFFPHLSYVELFNKVAKGEL